MAVVLLHSLRALVDSNGIPYASAEVYVYDVGTTTLKTVYSDSALTTPAANPVVCPAGVCPLRYLAAGTYKVAAKTSADVDLPAYSGDNIDPGVPVGSGALPVASGGTGGTTAAAARTNLAAASATDVATTQSDIANLQTWTGYTLTTKSRMATGTTGQQPAASTAGGVRFDTTLALPLIDNGSAWKKIAIEGKLDYDYFATGTGTTILLQRSRTTLAASQTISAIIPADSSIPQIGEGTEITGFSVAFTPRISTSVLRVKATIRFGTSGANGQVVIAVFKNGAANAVAAETWNPNVAATKNGEVSVEYEFAPGSVSAQTIAVRGGSASGDLVVNSDGAGVTLGGLRLSSLIIEEWVTR